jgi:hypothetical protein
LSGLAANTEVAGSREQTLRNRYQTAFRRVKTMRVRMLVVCMFLLATMGPPLLAGDAFWHGVDVAESGLLGDGSTQADIHEMLVDAMPPGLSMPLGDIVYGNAPGTRGVTIYKPRKCWNGYVYVNSMPLTPNGNRNCLIDMKGNIINDSWKLMGYGPVPAAEGVSKFLPGGHVIGSIRENEGKGAGKLVQLDWDGNLVHEWSALCHHDHQREGNPCGYYAPYQLPKTMGGKVLALEFSFPPKSETGYISSAFKVIDDRIRVMSWSGCGEDDPEFEWYARDHYEELVPDEAGQAATRLGLNLLPGSMIGPPEPDADDDPREDWAHGNAVAWVGPNKWWNQCHDARFHPENIIADFRSLNVTIIIARYDHPYGNWHSGDIIWQLGPDYSSAGENYKVGQIIGQHNAHMIPMCLPGEGNFLLFDNGGQAGYGSLIQGLEDEDGNKLGHWPNKFRYFSRVLEINPITKQIVWEYKQPNPTRDLNKDTFCRGNERRFYSNIMSGCQRLPNGNTQISEADTGRIFEVTPKGEVVWEYLLGWANPKPLPPGVPFFALIGQSAIYRAYRVPYSWVPKHLLHGNHHKKHKKHKK